jgi:mannose-6-phosphate isomerase-like protein (cupin superfamily)
MIKGKLWGTSEDLVATPMCEIHRVVINAGGHCSWHHHERKWNAFTVIEGTLVVEVDARPRTAKGAPNRRFNRQIIRTVLRPGDVLSIAPGDIHRFINGSGRIVKALEVYYPEGLSEDIVRRTVGGVY